MPLYDYGCGKHKFEFRHGMTEKPEVICPKCGEVAKKLFLETPHVELRWQAYDRRDTGNDRLVIRRGKAGKSTPLDNFAGKRT